MVSSRKRGRQEMEAAEPPEKRSMIDRIRNMWEFANLAQWIYIFGKAVKIDEDLDIEDLEMECLKSHSTVLSEIGLALLKFVSSHRGLTPEIFDEYTRRQYMAKAPKRNPFGDKEEPDKFADFDAFTKIRVLQQLTQWTMTNPDRIRERMEEQKDSDQTFWRIEPFGWDSEDRTYIVLDDNRLYRQTEPPPEPAPTVAPKKNSKKAKAALRASKRRKASEPEPSEDESTEVPAPEDAKPKPEYDGLGGKKWECLAITLDDLNRFVASIEKSRDPNEKILRDRIIEDLLPLLEKQEEARKRKAAQKERELLNLEKLAMAKRSSRIAGKLELQRQEEESRETERKRQADLAMAKKEQERWMKLEKERESRMMTREQRLKEREARRILHEEELAGLSEDSKKLEAGESRLSERHLKAEIEKKKQALEELAEEDDWVFDCICGAYGQVDDGSHSISCEKCNVWQHTKCVGISEAAASRDDFHFICKTCKRRAEEAEKAKLRPTIKLKFNRPGSSSSATVASPQLKTIAPSMPPSKANGAQGPGLSPQKAHSIHLVSPPRPDYESPYAQSRTLPMKAQSSNSNGLTFVPAPMPKTEGRPANQDFPPSRAWSPHSNNFETPRPNFSSPHSNGGHAFSSPLPHSPTSLPPPPQPRNYSFVNGHAQSGVPLQSDSTITLQQGINPQIQSRPLGPIHAPSDNQHLGYSLPPVQPALNGLPRQENSKAPSVSKKESQNGEQQHYMVQSMHRPLITSPIQNRDIGIVNTYSNYRDTENDFAENSNRLNARSQQPIGLPPLNHSSQMSSPSMMKSGGHSTIVALSHVSALPPANTGVSPTKHSPPRPANANGAMHISSASPAVLLPVAALSPSPQQPNLSPPIKMAEPERNRLSGQATAP